MDKNQNQEKGFLLISLLLAVVIMAILFMLYSQKSSNQSTSPAQVGQKAIEQTKENNQTQINQ